MSYQKKVSIFFDTNILEDRYEKGVIHLDGYSFSENFTTVNNFINDNSLTKDITLCIPEIVHQEIESHKLFAFKQQRKSLNDKIDEYKRIYGSLVNIEYNLKCDNFDEYKEYIDSEIEKYWNSFGNYIQLISTPKHEKMLEILVDKALNKTKPFREVKGSGKGASDAGFKDAVIVETMINYCIEKNQYGILFTNDRDFEDVFPNDVKNRFKVLFTKDAVIDYIKDMFEIIDKDTIRKLFETDEYLKSLVITETGNKYDDSVMNYHVKSVQEKKESTYSIDITVDINESLYQIYLLYDVNAHEIVQFIYNISND